MARTKLTIALDEDLREEDLCREPIDVEIPGLGTFEFPGVMNALATVRVARWSAAGRKDDLKPDEVLSLLGDLVPDDVLTEWSRRGFDLFDPRHTATVEAIVTDLLTEYQRRAGMIAASSGKALTPPPLPRTPPPFSSTGR